MSVSHDLVPQSSGFSFVSYVSAADKGYFDDPHLASIKARHQKNFLRDTDLDPDSVYTLSSLSNRNTYVRVLLKRNLITAFLKNFRNGTVQVISLGSGLDTFPFQLFAEVRSLPALCFVELDFQSVVKQKQYLAEDILKDATVFDDREWGSSHFRAWKTHPNSFDKSFYHLQSCDLRNLEELHSSLVESGIDFSKPALIFAEIVLVYLEPSHSDDLISFFATKFLGPCCFLNFDHVITDEAFGASMQETFADLQLPLLGLKRYPSIESQLERFTRLGWDRCSGFTMYEGLQEKIGKDGMSQLDEIEKVDEVERSRQILSHYGVFRATKGFKNSEEWTRKIEEMNLCTESGTSR